MLDLDHTLAQIFLLCLYCDFEVLGRIHVLGLGLCGGVEGEGYMLGITEN